MHLKRLEIHGFKTFASHTALEFRPGITAVIGPNGSGKSNINDAVRWVLGEQSYSALRSKRTEDIIFSGGGRRAPSGFAEVSLTIDNSDRLLALPYGEVTVTRKASRSGENEYYINRSRVRLRDLQEAVGPLGGSYTIINQGLVDAALTLRPEERRRLFEDAADIGTFVARKNESEAKLRETAANMERCADLLTELEPRIRSLKRQAALARSYRELNGDLRRLLLQHYARLWHAAQQALTTAEAQIASLAVDLEQRRSAQATATAELRTARAALRDLRERLGALHHQSSELHIHAETAQRNLAVSVERLAALNRREADAERSRRDLALRRAELERERAAIAERLQTADIQLVAARAQVEQQSILLATREQARRQAHQQLDIAGRAEAAIAAAQVEAARRASQLVTRRASLESEQVRQSQALIASAGQLDRQQAALKTAEAAAQRAEQARAAAAQTEESSRAEIEQLRFERSRADEALAAARRSLADLDARLESLSRLQRSYAGTFAGVRAAMQWAEAQQRSGFALVSALVRTPSQIETAIEVALGSRLQHIVVEVWSDAEDAIAALRASGVGRATFLPLDSVKGQRTEDKRQGTANDGVLGVAAALVEFDPHYERAVWNLLGRTLIVAELTTARRVLRELQGGWAIVTLAGEQVNSGGAITGGAQIKEAGVLRRERELRELPEEIAQARARVAAQTEVRTSFDATIQAAERASREAEAERRLAGQLLEQAREAERTARRETERAEGTLELQRRRCEQTAADLAALDEQQQAAAHEQATLVEREHAARTALIALREADSARAEEERTVQARVSELRAAATIIEGEQRTERALHQSHEHQLARLDQERSEADGQRRELDCERAAIQEQLGALEARHANLLNQIDELRARIDPAEAELATLEAERSATEQREAALTMALLEAESAYGRASIELERSRDRIDTLWERAAADDIDLENVSVAGDQLALEGESADARHGTSDEEQPAASDVPLPTNHEPETIDNGQRAITTLKVKIQRLGAVNPLALEEFEATNQRYEFMTKQLDDLQHAAAALRTLISELDGAMRTRFETTFASIAVEFEKCFVRLFGGGEAKLFLTNGDGVQLGPNGVADSIDDLGIDITVRPPGKRQQNIALLSGGERALTASALLFAILAVNPSPFCILDEVDAALDEANVGRFRAMLSDLGGETQFILVTHNRGTIEAADTIYGVSMGDDGASRVISLRLEELGVA